MDIKEFQSLSLRERSLICIAVLLDGFEASSFLANDLENGQVLEKLTSSFASLKPELRTPLIGTLLRQAIREGNQE